MGYFMDKGNLMKKITMMTALVLLLQLSPLSLSADDGIKEKINWSAYADAKHQNKDNRKYFIYFYIDQCPACDMMEKQTFKNKNVINYINSHFTPVRVNARKESKLVSRFGIWGFPHLKFLTPEGNNIAGWPGYIQDKRLLIVLEYLYTDSYKHVSFKDFIESRKGK